MSAAQIQKALATLVGGGVLGNVDTSWTIVGHGDFNRDGYGDLLWYHTSGSLAVWLLQGTTVRRTSRIGVVDPGWTIAGCVHPFCPPR